MTCDAPIPQKFNSKGEIVKLFFNDSPQTTYIHVAEKKVANAYNRKGCQQYANSRMASKNRDASSPNVRRVYYQPLP